jgi:hypothetical protein
MEVDAMLQPASISLAPGLLWNRATPAERLGYVVAGLLLASGLIHVAILVSTGGSWQGPLSLRKPATFGLSFGLTLATIVWLVPFLKLAERARWLLVTIFTAASVLETSLVTLQAWRGVPSHFNVETTFDSAVTRGLAGGGAVPVAIIVMLTTAAFRSNPDVPHSLRLAIQTGLVALCGSMAVGGVMIGRGMTFVSGGDPQTAYLTGGILKPMHAVGMHAILVLPVIAWLLSFADRAEEERVTAITIAAAGYVLLAVVVTGANLIGLL